MINLIDHYKNGEKLYNNIIINVAKKYDLTMMEFNIIIFLHNNPVYDTASEIVKYRHLVKSHVSTSVKNLLNQGYLIANFKKDDHKSIHLSLTSKCDKIINDGVKAQKEYLNLLLEGFSKEDKDTLLKLIKNIDINVNKNLK